MARRQGHSGKLVPCPRHRAYSTCVWLPRGYRATGIAVAALRYGGAAENGWIAAVLSPVVGLVIAIPYHYTGTFGFNWITHLGPIYVATVIFVVGALLALRAMMQSLLDTAHKSPSPRLDFLQKT